ncbi:hypothetical protein PoB_001114900 [Plakobranchus ocellatus]|uniref:Uncharacterized protein n=1 Tax=Plakobranchus ocellatus TaxID=259542 RepID=A0AAV3YNN4_9GAST|nr:hypothetical protein PoB_001114900 [Plakobranchus ocellatus]
MVTLLTTTLTFPTYITIAHELLFMHGWLAVILIVGLAVESSALFYIWLCYPSWELAHNSTLKRDLQYMITFFACVHVLTTATPSHVCHVVQPVLFTLIYVIFTLVWQLVFSYWNAVSNIAQKIQTDLFTSNNSKKAQPVTLDDVPLDLLLPISGMPIYKSLDWKYWPSACGVGLAWIVVTAVCHFAIMALSLGRRRLLRNIRQQPTYEPKTEANQEGDNNHNEVAGSVLEPTSDIEVPMENETAHAVAHSLRSAGDYITTKSESQKERVSNTPQFPLHGAISKSYQYLKDAFPMSQESKQSADQSRLRERESKSELDKQQNFMGLKSPPEKEGENDRSFVLSSHHRMLNSKKKLKKSSINVQSKPAPSHVFQMSDQSVNAINDSKMKVRKDQSKIVSPHPSRTSREIASTRPLTTNKKDKSRTESVRLSRTDREDQSKPAITRSSKVVNLYQQSF